MSLLGWLLSFIAEAIARFWLSLLPPHVHQPKEREEQRAQPRGATIIDKELDEDRARLGHDIRLWCVVTSSLLDRSAPEEDVVSEQSFLSQLEQRTQQVKITLANLEAEKVRIEGQIAQLQPIVPQYDALIAAERSLSEAQITLERAEPPAPPEPQPEQPQQEQYEQPQPSEWAG